MAPVKIACEAAIRMGWDEIIGEHGHFVGMTGFGASAPAKDVYKHFGITTEAVVEAALRVLGREAAAAGVKTAAR
jgi:transketolase